MKHVLPLALAVVLVSGCTLFPGVSAPPPEYGIRFKAMHDMPSPNFEPRPRGVAIDMLIIHYTGMENAVSALAHMRDPKARVSAHFVIDEDGTIYRMVAENKRAWHAGTASWGGETNINDRSIGIELVNPGTEFGYRHFPEPQMLTLERLAGDLLERHAIPARNVLGHSDVAPARKQDPGELFDWARLAAAGIGLWPATHQPKKTDNSPDILEAQKLLKSFGYDISANGEEDEHTRLVITAFQSHFHPSGVRGKMDAGTFAVLRAVAAAAQES